MTKWLADTLECMLDAWAGGTAFGEHPDAPSILDSCLSVEDIESTTDYDYAETMGRAMSAWRRGEPVGEHEAKLRAIVTQLRAMEGV